jgi:hypothetical protein
MTPPSRSRCAVRRAGPILAAAVVAAALAATGAAPGAFAAAPAEVAAVTVPEPVVHYAFDDDPSSGTVTDDSGHGLDGILVNASTATVVDGDGGGEALHLPGGSASSNGAHVKVPKAVLDGRTDVTVTARVSWDGTGGPWQRIFDLGKDTSRYLFTTPSNGSALRTAVTTNYGGGEATNTGYAPLPANTWKTVAVTLDTEADRITTYLDGAAVASAPTTVTATQLVDGASSGGFLGKSMYPDSLFGGSLDDFAVYGAALTAEQIAEATGVTPPAVEELTKTSFDVYATVGTEPELPASVRASFSDGYDRDVPITWDSIDASQYAEPGAFTAQGTAAGRTVTAAVTVRYENQVDIDLSTGTGDFMGGASGTLYGVYGQDIPSNNLIDGINLRTVATKAQDGPQHPGADALEVLKPVVDSSGGDVYIYMTDIYRGFPYEWPGDTPEARLDDFKAKIKVQVDQVKALPEKYRSHVVFVPFNEPEGNMFGTGQWSYNKVSWLSDPQYYFKAWDDVHAIIKGELPDARIAGPNTSILYDQVQGFMKHALANGTMPDVITWHELSNPASIRTNVAKFRGWEDSIYRGTPYEGEHLPVNIDEYAFNYHTSVPGQMIQWVSALEDSKVDGDIAYWNIDGNLSDSAVEANKGNGQWWLLHAYSQMTGHTVELTPPYPNENYTLQGVATLDQDRRRAEAIMGGAGGDSYLNLAGVDPKTFGSSVHVSVKEIRWSGQIGDNPGPADVAELDLPVKDDGVAFWFGKDDVPALSAESAYQIVVTPGANATAKAVTPDLWQATYEAENAAHSGSGYSRNGPEGSPSNLGGFYTSDFYDVGGIRTGSDVKLDFAVDVPKDGTYDLSVFANSLNTYGLLEEQGPTNAFVTVDGKQEQEVYLTLGYKWVVWDHSDTTVDLSAGKHTITIAAQSLDGTKSTKGDAIIDKIDLSLPNPDAEVRTYEGEDATLTDGATADYSVAGVSGSGSVDLAKGTATFWVYSPDDGEHRISFDTAGSGQARLKLNGQNLGVIPRSVSRDVFLSGGINKITMTAKKGELLVDRIRVAPSAGVLTSTTAQAEDGTMSGSATVTSYPLADGGKAVTDIGGDPGNDNTLTMTATTPKDGTYAITVRYSNGEQSPASHYNPDPLARHADVSVNGGAAQRVWFPHTFHDDNFWTLTFYAQLKAGDNTLSFRSEELPDWNGDTYISDRYPNIDLRSQWAPNLDWMKVTPLAAD